MWALESNVSDNSKDFQNCQHYETNTSFNIFSLIDAHHAFLHHNQACLRLFAERWGGSTSVRSDFCWCARDVFSPSVVSKPEQKGTGRLGHAHNSQRNNRFLVGNTITMQQPLVTQFNHATNLVFVQYTSFRQSLWTVTLLESCVVLLLYGRRFIVTWALL